MAALALLTAVAVMLSAFDGERTGVLLATLILSPTIIIVGCVFNWYQRTRYQRSASAFAFMAGSLAVLASVAITHWPLRVSYALSRSSFDAMALRIRNGQPISGPARAGLFTILRGEVSRDGIVCLWTETNSGGNTGFVQCRRDHVPFNLWSMIALDDRWQFIAED